MKLSIITLNYKKAHLTIQCVNSVYTMYSDNFKSGYFELIIVDNNSEDGSAEKISQEIQKNKYINVHTIKNTINAGFGGGNNYGAKKAKGKYLCFLNNDTIVKDKGIEDMVHYMENNDGVSVLGAQLRNSDGTLQSSSGDFYTPLKATLLLLGIQRFGLLDKNPESVSKVDWVKGALFMIKKNIFVELNGFDENIFMYTEDMELCYRAFLKGYYVYFYPFVQIIHADQGSSSRTFAIVNIYKNLLYFYKKHRSPREYTYIRTLMILKAKLLIAYGKIFHSSYLVSTYEQAHKVL